MHFRLNLAHRANFILLGSSASSSSKPEAEKARALEIELFQVATAMKKPKIEVKKGKKAAKAAAKPQKHAQKRKVNPSTAPTSETSLIPSSQPLITPFSSSENTFISLAAAQQENAALKAENKFLKEELDKAREHNKELIKEAKESTANRVKAEVVSENLNWLRTIYTGSQASSSSISSSSSPTKDNK